MFSIEYYKLKRSNFMYLVIIPIPLQLPKKHSRRKNQRKLEVKTSLLSKQSYMTQNIIVHF